MAYPVKYINASFPVTLQQHELLKVRFQHSRDCGFQGDFAHWILHCVLLGSDAMKNFGGVR